MCLGEDGLFGRVSAFFWVYVCVSVLGIEIVVFREAVGETCVTEVLLFSGWSYRAIVAFRLCIKLAFISFERFARFD